MPLLAQYWPSAGLYWLWYWYSTRPPLYLYANKTRSVVGWYWLESAMFSTFLRYYWHWASIGPIVACLLGCCGPILACLLGCCGPMLECLLEHCGPILACFLGCCGSILACLQAYCRPTLTCLLGCCRPILACLLGYCRPTLTCLLGCCTPILACLLGRCLALSAAVTELECGQYLHSHPVTTFTLPTTMLNKLQCFANWPGYSSTVN